MLFSSQTLLMLHHKVWSSQIRTLWVRSTRSYRFVIDLNFQNLSVHIGLTNSSFSVWPSSLSWSRFSISVQPIRTVRSHLVAVAACDSASQCHRVSQLGQTDRVWIYISTRWILEISLKPFALSCPALSTRGLRIVISITSDLLPLVSAAVNGIFVTIVAIASSPPS